MNFDWFLDLLTAKTYPLFDIFINMFEEDYTSYSSFLFIWHDFKISSYGVSKFSY